MALVNNLWLSLSKHGFLLPNLHIPGHWPGQTERAPGSSRSRESIGWEPEPRLAEGLRLPCQATQTSLPWTGAQFPHLENEGL